MTQLWRRYRRSRSLSLATTYLSIIMVMSLGFSAVFYYTSSHELDRQVPHNIGQMQQPSGFNYYRLPPNNTVDNFLANRAREGRHELFMRLIAINVGALVLGGAVSYLLARRALRPIEESMEAQAQFVSDASHELRTPLTAIQASNEVSLRNPNLTLANAKSVIHGNSEEAVKLQQLSEGLLGLARQDAQQLAAVAVNLQAAATAAINIVIPAAQAKNVTINDSLPLLNVLSSEQGLRQVLVILLDNAVKYGKTGGVIGLSATQKGKSLTIAVQDDGIGIRASDLPHIFRRFYRADSARSDSQRQGYGLGLAIAQTIIQQSGGSISARSEIGKGSTFRVKLMLAK